MTLRAANLKRPTVPTLPVYYWLDATWTLDEKEATEISEGLMQDSLHGIAYFKPDTPHNAIDRAIRQLVLDQRQPAQGMMLQAVNRWFV